MAVTAAGILRWAREGLHQGEIAAMYNVNPVYFSRFLHEHSDYLEAWERGRALYKAWLRQQKKRKIMNGDTTTLLHESKHVLGEHDKSFVEHEHGGEVNVFHRLLKEIDGQSRGLPDHLKEVYEIPQGGGAPVPSTVEVIPDKRPDQSHADAPASRRGEPLKLQVIQELPDPDAVPRR